MQWEGDCDVRVVAYGWQCIWLCMVVVAGGSHK